MKLGRVGSNPTKHTNKYLAIMEKECVKCKETKDENEFSFKNTSKGKRNGQCRTCTRAAINRHYGNNKKYYNAKSTKSRKENILKLAEYKRNLKCTDCGFDFSEEPFLCDFHHLGDKKMPVGLALSSGWGIVAKEILKCIPLCAMCHRRRHAKERMTL